MKALPGALAVFMAVATIASAQPVMPPPPAEAGPPPPMPGPNGWVLEPGHWHWNGVTYVWRPRHWIHERVGWHFVPGHWQPTGHGPIWIAAHWAP
jgi:hypothetical protein